MRNVELRLASGDHLDVRHFNVQETLSAAFRIDLVARSSDDALHLRKIVGHKASFRLDSDHGPRTWTGVVANAAQTAVSPEGLSTYTLTLAPDLWLLTHRKNHRIFQHLSAPEIAQKLLHEWHIHPVLHLSHKHPKLAMRVQYGESDYDFLRRILGEAGITFFFHAVSGEDTKVVLTDNPSGGHPRSETPVPFHADSSLARAEAHVSDVNIHHKVVPSRAVTGDYDFRRPGFSVQGSHATGGGGDGHNPMLEEYHFLPGHSLAEADSGGEPLADQHGTYRHHDAHAASHAKRRADGHQAAGTKVGFNTTLADLSPGTIFAMSGHPHPEVAGAKKLLVTHSWITGDATGHWHSGGHAVPADKPYHPHLDTGMDAAHCDGRADPYAALAALCKPRIHGTQSAIVTGPSGEEIYTDEHGRVKLHFPWDRGSKLDEHSSPWIRVSQAWAGAGFGNTTVPRVGQEVLVSYQDGDPDHPVVVGRMHNATAPVPYPLPEHRSRTVFKSNGSDGANEITFDDKHDHELFYVQAQRDLHKIVKHDEMEHTHGDRHISVDGDLVLSAKGRVVIHSGGQDVVVKGGPHVKLNPSESPKPAHKPKPLSGNHAKSSHHDKSAANSNARLHHMSPGHLPGSIETAGLRKHLAEKYQADAIKLGKKHHVPPALILALMSRESGFGTLLDANGRGDHGHGYGILQVDVGTIAHPKGGPYSYEHLDQAMGIFDSKLQQIKVEHPGWTSDQQLAGAVSAYNQGAGNVWTQPSDAAGWARMDSTTTGHNYSMDVWAQAQWYADNLKW